VSPPLSLPLQRYPDRDGRAVNSSVSLCQSFWVHPHSTSFPFNGFPQQRCYGYTNRGFNIFEQRRRYFVHNQSVSEGTPANAEPSRSLSMVLLLFFFGHKNATARSDDSVQQIMLREQDPYRKKPRT